MFLLLLMDSFRDHTHDDQINAWGPIQSVTKKGASEKPPFHFSLQKSLLLRWKEQVDCFL